MFLKGLTAIEPNINHVEPSAILAPQVQIIQPDNLKAFLRTVFALYRMMDARESVPQVIADGIKETIESEKPKNFPLEKLDVLRNRLQKILSIGGMLHVVAKARGIIPDQERIFCGSKVLSDIRPVFPSDPSSISAAAIIHSLNISYHQNGRHKDFYVALATPDLAKLKKEIERAEKKAITMKSFVEKANIRFFEGE